MDEDLKKRLVGATVLASLAVIFVPMLLDKEPILEQGLQQSNIPPRPERAFSSQVLPSESESLSRPPPGVIPLPPAEKKPPVKVEQSPPPSAEVPPEVDAQGSKPSPSPKKPALSSWVIQAGSFSSRESADTLVERLRGEKFDAFVEPAQVKGKKVYRVRVGPEIDRRKADQTLLRINRILKPLRLEATVITYP